MPYVRVVLSIPCAFILRRIHGAVKKLVLAGVFKFASFAVLDMTFLESYRKPSANIYSVIPPSSLLAASIYGLKNGEISSLRDLGCVHRNLL
ncbi:hypothetical protein AVEN_47897-1 [Araneus ventricosus]|uniref:Uncharacterized protein n=1 Tax=Araneus ventricosus TaxID=182803 RepID=A0A4Y2QKU4_ARAVE|nr:hypothetical protein AVEN_47897-1 [Araneus ventricosus]